MCIGGVSLMYRSVKYFSELWRISKRRIRKLCEENRIKGVFKEGRRWNIPEDASKHIDNRESISINMHKVDFNFSKLDEMIIEYNQLKHLSNNQLRMIKENLSLRLTYNSNAIEGNTLTLKETKVAIEGIAEGGKSVVEHLEVVNHMNALDFFYNIVEEELSERRIKDIHRLISGLSINFLK